MYTISSSSSVRSRPLCLLFSTQGDLYRTKGRLRSVAVAPLWPSLPTGMSVFLCLSVSFSLSVSPSVSLSVCLTPPYTSLSPSLPMALYVPCVSVRPACRSLSLSACALLPASVFFPPSLSLSPTAGTSSTYFSVCSCRCLQRLF